MTKSNLDPRVELILDRIAAPGQGADPLPALYDAADALSLSGVSDAAEAAALLQQVLGAWGATATLSAIRHAAGRTAAQSARDGAMAGGDELAAHLRDQAGGRYALAPWPWPALTRESRSLMPGSVTIVCGAPGASKSWFGLSCLRYWTEHGIEARVLMLEETPKWHLQRALAQCSGCTDLLRPEWIAANRAEAEAIYEQHRPEIADVRTRLTCDGNLTMAQVADWVERQCDAGARIIIIDPISLADNGNDKPWDADRKFMARAKVAVEKAGASLILVTHPRKAGGPGKGGPPQLDDLAGGAAYGRACASALWVAGLSGTTTTMCVDAHGNVREAMPTKVIKILKARNSTGAGKAIAYDFRQLALEEIGVVVPSQPAAEPKSTRGRKLKASPSQDEDAFAQEGVA